MKMIIKEGETHFDLAELFRDDWDDKTEEEKQAFWKRLWFIVSGVFNLFP